MSCVGTRPPLLQEVQMYRNHHHASEYTKDNRKEIVEVLGNC